MATSTQVASQVSAVPEREVVRTSVPWYLWCVIAAVVAVMIGGYWDISWHMSIGRDTFWTPAHMAIYFCGVLAGVSCGYLILYNTFVASAPEREASVKIWGLRAPLGAFICAWGGLAMLASAPFDNWWHAAYGLDVKIFSPPHTVLDTGILAIQIGGMVLIMGARNRATGAARAKLDRIFLFLGAMIVSLAMIIVWEYTYRVFLHSSRSYIAISIVAPILLVGAARASGRRWAGTSMAAIFSLYAMVLLWIFPLFPATPRLGPVYQHITHFVPMEFPLLLIAPAVALDLLGLAFPAWIDGTYGCRLPSSERSSWLHLLLSNGRSPVSFCRPRRITGSSAPIISLTLNLRPLLRFSGGSLTPTRRSERSGSAWPRRRCSPS